MQASVPEEPRLPPLRRCTRAHAQRSHWRPGAACSSSASLGCCLPNQWYPAQQGSNVGKPTHHRYGLPGPTLLPPLGVPRPGTAEGGAEQRCPLGRLQGAVEGIRTAFKHLDGRLAQTGAPVAGCCHVACQPCSLPEAICRMHVPLPQADQLLLEQAATAFRRRVAGGRAVQHCRRGLHFPASRHGGVLLQAAGCAVRRAPCAVRCALAPMLALRFAPAGATCEGGRSALPAATLSTSTGRHGPEAGASKPRCLAGPHAGQARR